MATLHNPNDTVTVAPGVITTIVRMATLSVAGVERTASPSGGVDRWIRWSLSDDSVRIEIDETGVHVEVYLVVNASRSLYETSHRVQQEVARTIKEYAGMKVSAVNIHIEDIVFNKS